MFFSTWQECVLINSKIVFVYIQFTISAQRCIATVVYCSGILQLLYKAAKKNSEFKNTQNVVSRMNWFIILLKNLLACRDRPPSLFTLTSCDLLAQFCQLMKPISLTVLFSIPQRLTIPWQKSKRNSIESFKKYKCDVIQISMDRATITVD